MTINIAKLELALSQKINSELTDLELLIYSKALEKLKTNSINSVASFEFLPFYLDNIGSLYFVDSDERLYWASETGWILITIDFANQLWTWGSNDNGQLGNGDRCFPTSVIKNSFIWDNISIDRTLSVAVKTDGTLWTWGRNVFCGLGDGTNTSRSSPGTTIGGGTDWSKAAAGTDWGAAIKTDGTLWTWGRNHLSQLGNGGSGGYVASPVTTAGGGTNWSKLSIAYAHGSAIKTDGTLWTWGNGGHGELGNNSTSNRSSPGTTAGGGTNWCLVSVSTRTSAAIKTDGTLWTWGRNHCGQLGDGTTTNRSSPVTTASGGTNWASISIGEFHSVAVKTDGTLWGWGLNNYSQLGDGTTSNRSSPTNSIGGTNWSKLATGCQHSLGLKTDGTLWGWGFNQYGQLGDNSKIHRSSPVAAQFDSWCLVAANGHSSGGITVNVF